MTEMIGMILHASSGSGTGRAVNLPTPPGGANANRQAAPFFHLPLLSTYTPNQPTGPAGGNGPRSSTSAGPRPGPGPHGGHTTALAYETDESSARRAWFDCA